MKTAVGDDFGQHEGGRSRFGKLVYWMLASLEGRDARVDASSVINVINTLHESPIIGTYWDLI